MEGGGERGGGREKRGEDPPSPPLRVPVLLFVHPAGRPSVRSGVELERVAAVHTDQPAPAAAQGLALNARQTAETLKSPRCSKPCPL